MSCVIYDLETMNLSTTCIAKEEMEPESTRLLTNMLKKMRRRGILNMSAYNFLVTR